MSRFEACSPLRFPRASQINHQKLTKNNLAVAQFVGKFTVLVRRSCMMLCVLVLAHCVMVLSLLVMGRGVIMSRG